MKTKRFIGLFLIPVLAVLLFAPCFIHNSYGETNHNPQINAPDQYEDESIWYCNRFMSVGTPPFSIPEAPGMLGQILHKLLPGVSKANYDAFLSGLTADGFSLVTTKRSDDFLFRDDCMIFSKYREADGSFSVAWYQESPYAPRQGISYEEAASLLMPDRDDSLSKIPIHPIDITPDGFYERTGGQIFAVPYYSYDSFRRSGYESLMFDMNEYYDWNVYYVIGDQSFVTSMESVAVCDIDNDGSDEVLLLSFGPTSGLFTFAVTCVTNEGVYDSIYCTDYYKLGFSNRNGKLVIEGVGYDSYHHYCDIVLEEHDGEKYVMLYNDGERLRILSPMM